jgi:hypothetical protein
MLKSVNVMTCLIICVLAPLASTASTNYYVVSSNENAVSPFTNWVMAATNLNDPINMSLNGDTIYVTNATYAPTNYYNITKAITIIGAGGRPMFNGSNLTTCMFLLNITGAVLSGVIISNVFATNPPSAGYSQGGGGIHLQKGTVSNCIITACVITNEVVRYMGGGGIYVYCGTVVDCVVSNNRAETSVGGGIVACYNSYIGSGPGIQSIVNCRVVNNYSGTRGDQGTSGGGIGVINSQTVISNCVILANSIATWDTSYARGSGIGVYLGNAPTSTVIVRNCLIAYNSGINGAFAHPPFFGGYSIMENCTIVSNNNVGCSWHYYNPQPPYCTSMVANTIIYSNQLGNWERDSVATVSFTNCCTTPTNNLPGTNNIASDPAFVNQNAGDFHLAQGSPCINSGLNQSWMNGTFDLDGHSRLDHFSRLVDMGCYEYLPSGMMISVP